MVRRGGAPRRVPPEAEPFHDVVELRSLVLDRDAVTLVRARGIELQPAYEWLLEPGKD